jgi:hypothetical protein
MFGVDNTGVINQRQSPAIWQSDIANFPANYILGRILIDTFQGGIYIDTANTRMQISSGANNYINGLSNFGGSPGTNNVGLGGGLDQNTYIQLDGRVLTFEGANNNIIINDNGDLISTGTGNGQFLPAAEVTLQVVVPNTTLYFFNTNSGVVYKVNAQAF